MIRAALLMQDKDARRLIQAVLEFAGFACESYDSTEALLRMIKRQDHGLVVADADSPATDCAALHSWRANWLNPGVTLVAIGSDRPQICARALDDGMDDFVTKPVQGVELLARVAAATRRLAPRDAGRGLSVAGCSIDRATSSLVSAHSRVTLTGRELALAQMLFENAGRLVTRERLARELWGRDAELSSRSIDQHVYQLRRKLKRCVGPVLTLHGVYGNGYRIDVADPPRVASPDEPSDTCRATVPRRALAERVAALI